MLLLVDCNNFFASCERIANPKLIGRPIVVLSRNNGIIVARSEEAKALQIPMGGAAFAYEAIFKKYNVYVASSHFSLYKTISRQVMEVLCTFSQTLEIYSIDEAFLKVETHDPLLLTALACKIRSEVLQKTKVAVSIGVAKTKTLSKAANYFAKKDPTGVQVINEFEREAFLERMPIEEVWGIGSKLSQRLKKRSVYTALDFVQKSDYWLRKELSVMGLRIAWELRGVVCYEVAERAEPNKSVSTARSFSSRLTALHDIAAVLEHYTIDVVQEITDNNQLATAITVFLATSFFGTEEKYANQASIILPEPSNSIPYLIEHAKRLLASIYQEGFQYKKVGIMLSRLVPVGLIQQDLFCRYPQVPSKLGTCG